MRFKNKQKCERCGNLYRNLHIRKGKFLCWKCLIKDITIIGAKNEKNNS